MILPLKFFLTALVCVCLLAQMTNAGKLTRRSKAEAAAAAATTTISDGTTVENANATAMKKPDEEANSPTDPADATPTKDGEGDAEEDADSEAEADGDADVEEEEEETEVEVDKKKQTVATPSAPPSSTPSLSIWGFVRNVWQWIRDDLSESLLGAVVGDDDANDGSAVGSANGSSLTATPSSTTNAAVEGRTFGKIRRLQMALIPIIFKFGILSAMVAFLVLLGMKTLFLLKVLIVMNAAAILGKFLTFKSNFAHFEHPPASVSWGYSNWNPHQSHGWSEPSGPATAHHAPSKEIHLHIHGAQTQPQVAAYSTYGNAQQGHSNGGWERRHDPYNVYDPAAASSDIEIENELNNQGPINALPTKYPANHRY